MSQPGNTAYIERKLAHVCVRSGCVADASDDSDECAAHHEDSKARKRKSAAKTRARLRKEHRCRDCRKRSKTLRCQACKRKQNRKRRGVDATPNVVDKAAGSWREDPGTNWIRYRGKARRGRLTREQQIDEDARDAQFAVKQIGAFIENLDDLKNPDWLSLPRIQQQAKRREAAAPLAHAARFLDELVDRYS